MIPSVIFLWVPLSVLISACLLSAKGNVLMSRLSGERKRIAIRIKNWKFNASRILHRRPGPIAKSIQSRNRDYDISNLIKLGKEYTNENNKMWKLVYDKNGIKVWKARKILTKGKDDKHWPCTKTQIIVDSTPEKVASLLMDSSKVKSCNKYSAGRDDVEKIDSYTKIVWNRTKVPLSYKDFDFCTLMHKKIFSKDNYLLISKGVKHSLVPEKDTHRRSHIIFGANLIRKLPSISQINPKYPNDKSKNKKIKQCEIISINHVQYQGIPPALASRTCVSGVVNYSEQLRSIIQKI